MGDTKIKRGLNIYLYYWTIVILIFLITLNYFSRNFKVEALDVGLMISIVSFLFGFSITISFSMLLSRVSSLKDSLAFETGRLVSLYALSKNLGEKFYKKVSDRIDDYTICTLRDYSNYHVGREAIYGLYEDVKNMEVENENQKVIANSFLYILGEFEPIREKLEYLTSRRIEWPLKLTNYILGIMLIILLFLNRGDAFTNSIFIILSTVIVFIFLIIEDFDNLRIGDYTYNISNSEQIFDLIGRDRYYPKNILNRVKLEKGKTYRIGIYDKKLGKDKIISLKYNPAFRIKLNFLSRKFGDN